ncbi:hypothetical protein DPMN_054425 [Dreissena polymorpha]|uniref:Uncharacterized protein n=1 Tax=Dreissena polymorpha TaxID=45954 RepID=A0A9D4CQB2_DREPO|nr:hypothetical protein DPMN_054425 [Dreissena polymorpha]
MLGDISLTRKIIVAEIEDDALLGIDILQNDEGGPADLLLSRGVILFQGIEIPCIQVGLKEEIGKVQAADNYTTSGQSEAIIDVMVDILESDDLMQDTIVGQAEKIDHIKGTVVEKEHSDEEDNFISVRRVTIKQDEPTIIRATEMNTKESFEVPSH